MNTVDLTAGNIAIAREFVVHASEFAEGVLLSGSNAWGANYAVTESSDIDLLVIVQKIDEIGLIIDKYILAGLVDSFQKERFEIFLKLFNQNKADTFSFRVNYKDTWVGIDFYTLEIASNICEFKGMGDIEWDDIKLRVVKEFRSNPPMKGGYSVDELGGNRRLTYNPEFEEIKNEEITFGYVSKTLIDGYDNNSYFLGVMAFFFAIEPVILLGGETVANLVKKIQENIKERICDKKIVYLTREERMTRETRDRIIHNLSSNIVH